MRYIFLFCTFVLHAVCNAQVRSVVLEHNGVPSHFVDLDSAYIQAVDGDVLYLSGGTHSFGVTYYNKSLTIYGAGVFPDSTLATLPTIINSQFYCTAGASGSFFTGIRFTNGGLYFTNTSNVAFSQCMIDELVFDDQTNALINGCVIQYFDENTGTSTGIKLSNSVIFYCEGNNLLFENDIIYNGSSTFSYSYIANSSFKNCVFILNIPITGGGLYSNQFLNNIFTADVTNLPSGIVFEENLTNIPPANIFPNVVYGTIFNFGSDYHLVSGSPAIGMGYNGADLGIYGGLTPFKDGMIPANPHIQKFQIPDITDQNGNLNINVSIQAQDQ